MDDREALVRRIRALEGEIDAWKDKFDGVHRFLRTYDSVFMGMVEMFSAAQEWVDGVCPSPEALDGLRRAKVIGQMEARALVRHLSRPCGECLARLETMEPVEPRELESTSSTVVRALRTLADRAGRQALWPSHRLAVDRVREPLGFAMLTMAEAYALGGTEASAALAECHMTLHTMTDADEMRLREAELLVMVCGASAAIRAARGAFDGAEDLESIRAHVHQVRTAYLLGAVEPRVEIRALLHAAEGEFLEWSRGVDDPAWERTYAEASTLLDAPGADHATRSLRVELLTRVGILRFGGRRFREAWDVLGPAEAELLALQASYGCSYPGLLATIFGRRAQVAQALAGESAGLERRLWMAEALIHLQRARSRGLAGVPAIEQALRMGLEKSLGDAFVRELECPVVDLEVSAEDAARIQRAVDGTPRDGRVRLLLKPWLEWIAAQEAT